MPKAILCALLCATCLALFGCSSSSSSTQETPATSQEQSDSTVSDKDSNAQSSKSDSTQGIELFTMNVTGQEQSETVTIEDGKYLHIEASVASGEATLTLAEPGGYEAFSRTLSGEVSQTIDGIASGAYTVTVSGEASGTIAFSLVKAGK